MIIKINWKVLLYHWHIFPAINYGKFLVLLFFKTFPAPTFYSFFFWFVLDASLTQKQPSRGVLRKRCSENMQQIYRRKPMLKCDCNKVATKFIEITLRHGCSPVKLLHIFRTLFSKNTSGRLLLLKKKTKFKRHLFI